MGLSIRAYARHRGVSHVAVMKAIEAGRITQEADGAIDPEQADREWEQNTASPRKRSFMQNQATEPIQSTLSPNGTSLLQARTVNEVVKAQTNKVRLAQLKGDLVDRPQAIAHVFKLARSERDAWLNWPTRISAQMAAKLDIDAHTLHVALEAAVREHLQELGDLNPRVD
ncbi:elements of external origin [Nitrosomonas supralitoralis]|uniref:Elements of external origin n=2 Tax=Nitrosomonas supralitoralis TaxID=2116706 RepID=A0A2P7NUM3_9PROT|nr:elements of external origin [Nitrosomonas supralitoralis]